MAEASQTLKGTATLAGKHAGLAPVLDSLMNELPGKMTTFLDSWMWGLKDQRPGKVSSGISSGANWAASGGWQVAGSDWSVACVAGSGSARSAVAAIVFQIVDPDSAQRPAANSSNRKSRSHSRLLGRAVAHAGISESPSRRFRNLA
eukprot:4399767-Alexandrium_andersonii.AAC.1